MEYYIKFTQDMGRGLYAFTDLEKGKVLFQAEVLVLSANDTIKVNQTDLQYYTFKFNETQDCLVLGDAELFNHDNSPNVGYTLQEHDGRKVMVFYMLKDVDKDMQLFINYSADCAVNVSNYTVNL